MAEQDIGKQELLFHDVRMDPFELYGLYRPRQERVFKRLPDAIADSVNEGVRNLYLNTAGGRVRFSTDSSRVAVRAAMPSVAAMPHMPLSGSSGFDLYIDDEAGSAYYRTFMPQVGMTGGYESAVAMPDRRHRNLTIHFPLYNNVDSLHIGLDGDASLGGGARYRPAGPVLYYGSSITQGGCASRPGNSYQAIIARKLNCDFINLGFSGSARGEPAMAEYMAGLDFSVFVCDYDHNAPTAEHLAATHEPLFRTIRNAHPDRPVIFVSKPDFDNNPADSIIRRDVVYRTFLTARQGGDANVYFIDGRSLFKDENRDCCTVDGTHPNDAGFVRMAEVIGYAVGQALANQRRP